MCGFLRLTFACHHSHTTRAISFCKTPKICLRPEFLDQGATVLEDIDANSPDIPASMIVCMALEGVYCGGCSRKREGRLVRQEEELEGMYKSLEEAWREMDGLEEVVAGQMRVQLQRGKRMKMMSKTRKNWKTDFIVPNGEVWIGDVLRMAVDEGVTPTRRAQRNLRESIERMQQQQQRTQKPKTKDQQDRTKELLQVSHHARLLLKEMPRSQTCRHSRRRELQQSSYLSSPLQPLQPLQQQSASGERPLLPVPPICGSGSCKEPVHGYGKLWGEFCKRHTCGAVEWKCLGDVKSPNRVNLSSGDGDEDNDMFCLAHTCENPGCEERVLEREWRFCGRHHWMEGDLEALRERLGRRS